MKTSRYESLVFAARHWEFLEWLEEHWEGPEAKNKDAIVDAAKKAGFEDEIVERIRNLCTQDRGRAQLLWDITDKRQHDDALKVVTHATSELRHLLRKTGCQCDEPKRKNVNSDYWHSDFAIRPKGIRKAGTFLTAGFSIDYALRRENRHPRHMMCLTLWFWLRAQSGASNLRRRFPTHELLDKSVEKNWPHLLVLGASEIQCDDDQFEFDVEPAVTTCLERMKDISDKDIAMLYENAVP